MSANAAQPKPTAPAPGEVQPPPTKSLPLVESPKLDQDNALLMGLKTTWTNIKSGNFGNRLVLLIVIGAAAIIGSWWFLARSSKQADSATWHTFEQARNQTVMQSFLEQPNLANTTAGKIVKLNLARDKATDATSRLSSTVLGERRKGLAELTEARAEIETLAEEFKNDRSIKASALLAAAKSELAMVGIRGEKANPLEFLNTPETSSVGKVAKYAELLKKVADTIGKDTAVGKKYLAQAEAAEKDPGKLYRTAAELYGDFFRADEAPKASPLDIPFSSSSQPK